MKNGGLAEPLQGRGSDPRPGKGLLDLAFRVSDPDGDRSQPQTLGAECRAPGPAEAATQGAAREGGGECYRGTPGLGGLLSALGERARACSWPRCPGSSQRRRVGDKERRQGGAGGNVGASEAMACFHKQDQHSARLSQLNSLLAIFNYWNELIQPKHSSSVKHTTHAALMTFSHICRVLMPRRFLT